MNNTKKTESDNTAVNLSNVYYSTCNNWGTTNTWSAIGAQLAKPEYRVISVKNVRPSRPYFRLKIFINKPDSYYTSDINNLSSENREIYNKYHSDNSDNSDNSNPSDNSDNSNLDDNWVYKHLKTLYNNARVKNNSIVESYKNGGRVYFDAGFDLFAPLDCNVNSESNVFKLDHCIQCSMDRVEFDNNGIETSHPVGYYLYPRSSMGTKTPLSLTNSVGIIDSGYRGNIIAALHYTRGNSCLSGARPCSSMDYKIDIFQRLVQICPPDLSYPTEIVIVDNEDELGDGGNRGKGGFGSTGN